jgi:hypothetical protein
MVTFDGMSKYTSLVCISDMAQHMHVLLSKFLYRASGTSPDF